AEDGLGLRPERGVVGIRIGLRGCRLGGAHWIRCREGIFPPGVELGLPIGGERLARIVGMLVVRRRIECLSHDLLHWLINAARLGWFPCSAEGRGGVSGAITLARTIRAPVFDQALP